jgi:hypothetical protein
VLVIAPGAYRRAQQANGGDRGADAATGSAAPGNAAPGTVPGNAAPGNVAAVPGNAVAATATPDSAVAGWEPDLDAAWETAALALGEDSGDEEAAWAEAADFRDFDYE